MVEDDSTYTKPVSQYFGKNGMAVVCAGGEKEALQLFAEQDFDCVLLDVRMSRDDEGFDIGEQIREMDDHVPIIYTTARVGLRDMEQGYATRADDYVTKPYSERALFLKVKSMLERRRGLLHTDSRLEMHGIALDLRAHSVTVDNVPVSLPRTQFKLLHALMESAGRVVSSEQLLDKVWGYNYDYGYDSSVVRNHIAKLRGALGESKRDVIASVRGFGYRFEKEK
jgi:DNA-binding response OmpR family regulator